MSNFYLNSNTSSGTIPPEVPESFNTDNGVAVPVANELNVLGGAGITTSAEPPGSDNLIISLQNSSNDTGQTIGATDLDITTIALPSVGTYTLEVRVAVWKISGGTGQSGAAIAINGGVRTNGVTATLIRDSDGFFHNDAELDGIDVNIIASGNNAIIRCSGIAGFTLNWGAFSVYVFRGV